MQQSTVALVLNGKLAGHDLIEEPSWMGGLIVDEETTALVADLETVANIGFEGSVTEATTVLLQVMRNAEARGEDTFEAGRDWLDGWLDLDSANN